MFRFAQHDIFRNDPLNPFYQRHPRSPRFQFSTFNFQFSTFNLISNSQILSAETERQEALDAIEDVNLIGRTKQDFDGSTRTRLALADDLTASPARRTDFATKLLPRA